MSESNQILYRAKRARQDVFIEAYMRTGSKIIAAQEALVKPAQVNEWRRDPLFMKRHDEARKYLGSRLEGAVFNRALEGVERGVYYEGERVGTEREYDHRREQTVLRALLPDEYGNKLEVDIKTLHKTDLKALEASILAEAAVVDAEYSVDDGDATGQQGVTDTHNGLESGDEGAHPQGHDTPTPPPTGTPPSPQIIP